MTHNRELLVWSIRSHELVLVVRLPLYDSSSQDNNVCGHGNVLLHCYSWFSPIWLMVSKIQNFDKSCLEEGKKKKKKEKKGKEWGGINH